MTEKAEEQSTKKNEESNNSNSEADSLSDSSEELEFEEDDLEGLSELDDFAADDRDFIGTRGGDSPCDSSDEEDLRNTIGNIPVKWYEDHAHVGYNTKGAAIAKLEARGHSEIDEFISRMEDKDYWRRIKDRQLGSELTLSDAQVAMLQQMQKGKYPTVGYNPYEPWIDFFSNEVEQFPLSNRPAHKRSFIPSKLDRQKVSKLVHALKMGWLKPRPPKALTEKDELDDEPKFYDLWAPSDEKDPSQSEQARLRARMAAPKMAPPGHAESYNPPLEYLMDEKEKAAWEEAEAEERKQNWQPAKYSCLRHVPAYPLFINERFDRCLDLYLAPRQRKQKLNVDPKDLLPELPDPRDLQPFPTTLSLTYVGHKDWVRCVVFEPHLGEFIVSGGDDKTIRVWETSTGRCLRTIDLSDVCRWLVWSPSIKTPTLIAAAVGKEIQLINISVGDTKAIELTNKNVKQMVADNANGADANGVLWNVPKEAQQILLTITLEKTIQQVVWHGAGDYLACVSPDAATKAVTMLRLSKCTSQTVFGKRKGLVQRVCFHPTRAWFYVATQTHVLVYDLQQQKLVKKLFGSCRSISCMKIHPKGDNLLIGSYDCRLSWFDLDLSAKPYKTLRHHTGAIRCVTFHDHLPLFASCADDGKLIICHGQVYSDLLQNALIVPVKVLGGHSIEKGVGALSCAFHPRQPWICSSGADATIKLFTY